MSPLLASIFLCFFTVTQCQSLDYVPIEIVMNNIADELQRNLTTLWRDTALDHLQVEDNLDIAMSGIGDQIQGLREELSSQYEELQDAISSNMSKQLTSVCNHNRTLFEIFGKIFEVEETFSTKLRNQDYEIIRKLNSLEDKITDHAVLSTKLTSDTVSDHILVEDKLDIVVSGIGDQIQGLREELSSKYEELQIAFSNVTSKLTRVEDKCGTVASDLKGEMSSKIKELQHEFSKKSDVLAQNIFSKMDTDTARTMAHLEDKLTSAVSEIKVEIAAKIQDLINEPSRNLSAYKETALNNVTTSNSPATEPCPDEWVHFEESCYYTTNISYDWLQGLEFCHSLDASYVKISTQAEWEFISGITSNWYWISLNDRETEGEFTWISDGSKPTFEKWGQNEPSDTDGNNDCVLSTNSGLWYTYQCEIKFKVVCEKNVESFGK